MIFVFIFAIYSLGLWRMSVPLTGDQKTYLSIALEMKEKASFIIPYLYDHANFLKPPFEYWMTLVGWQICGLSLFGALIPSVLALVGSSYLVQRLSKDRSPLSALVFAATLATMTYGTTAQMEIWIVLFYLAAWNFYLENKLFWTFTVVGVMAWIKGPLYPVLFVASIVFKAYQDRNFLVLRKPRFLLALGIGTALGLTWYFAAATTHFSELRDVFFGQENFGKMQTSQGTPWGLWSEFLMTLFPVIYLILASLGDPAFKSRLRTEGKFWLVYALIPALFFTFFPYRVNTYLYLLTPVAAWIAVQNPKPNSNLKLPILIFVSAVALLGSLLAFRLWMGQWVGGVLAISLIVTLGGWTFANFKMRGQWIAISSLVLVNLIRIAATDMGEWDLQPLRSVAANQDFSYRIEPNREDIWHELGLVSAALGKTVYRVKTPEEEQLALNQGKSILLSDDQFPMQSEVCQPWRRLKRRTKFPIKDLLFSGLSINDDSLHRTFQICALRK